MQDYQTQPSKDPRISHRNQYCCFIRKQILKKICDKQSDCLINETIDIRDIQTLNNHWKMLEETINLTDTQLDLHDMLLMAFLTRKYLRQLGQNWGDIATFIEMENIFQIAVTGQVVQKVYRLIKRFQKNKEVQTINQWSKNNLLFSYPGLKGEMQYKGMQPRQPMQAEQQVCFDFDKYDDMVKEAVTAPSLDEKIEDQFQEYARPILINIINDMMRFPMTKTNKTFQKISRVLSKFSAKSQPAKVVSSPVQAKYSLTDSINLVKNKLDNEDFKEKKSYQTLLRQKMISQFKADLKYLQELKESLAEVKKTKPKRT